jgi:hypothetical protein
MHIAQEQEAPGKTKYRVYNTKGALLYVGYSAGAAQEMCEIGEQEEIDAELARKTSSDRSSDGGS